MESKKKPEEKLKPNSRRDFIGKGGMTMMGGMFAFTALSTEEMGTSADVPIAKLLKLGSKGLTANAQKLTPRDMLAFADIGSSASKKRISSVSYLKSVSFRDIGSLNGAMAGKLGSGPIFRADDAGDTEGGDGGEGGDNDGGDGGDSWTIVCCCCCCCV